MELKVREVTPVEEKSQQQVEQELLDKHEVETNETAEVGSETEPNSEVEATENIETPFEFFNNSSNNKCGSDMASFLR